MSDITTLMMGAAGAGGGGAETDPNFNQTTLLLHGDGTNGAQNNTFLDASSNTFTITRAGNTTQGTFSPFSNADGQWSNYFDGTGDYLALADDAAWDFGSGDFTVEAWIYTTAGAGTSRAIVGQWQNSAASTSAWQLYITTSNTVRFLYAVGGSQITTVISTSTVPLNTWTHLAVSKSGTDYALWFNGVREATRTATETINNSAYELRVGNNNSNDYFDGFISNARVVKGSAEYSPASTTITVPTSPFPISTSNQQLLTCYGNRFADFNTATTAKTITVNGNTSVQPFSPFAPSAAYSTSVNGGSGYFDGTGDYLSVADNAAFDLGTDNFTIQGWVYLTSSAASQTFVAKGTGADSQASYHIVFDGTNWDYYLSGNGSTWSIASGVLMGAGQVNAWQHIALVRNGSTFTPYVNGVAGTTTTSATALFDSNKIFSIGADDPGNQRLTGYISGLQVLKGTAATITVPTTPPTAIANTSLLCNFTNAGIFDNTGKNNLETVGNAQIDTSVKKYGTGSMEFDGTGDYLVAPDSDLFDFGSGDFTIEMWINTTQTASGYFAAVAKWQSSQFSWLVRAASQDVGTGWSFFYSTNGSTNTSTLGSSINDGNWHHIAVSRSGSNIRLFTDGVLVNTNTSNPTIYSSSAPVTLGSDQGSQFFNGYIEDLRITKGVARYTAAFTPPTAAFPDL